MRCLNPLKILKQIIILFWSIWFTLATLTNFFDLLKYYHRVGKNWEFASNNLSMIENTISIYGWSLSSASILLIAAVGLESGITLFFWIAFLSSCTNNLNRTIWTNMAFASSISLWATFLIMDEFFIAYPFEPVHLLLLTSQLVCLIAIHFLPD